MATTADYLKQLQTDRDTLASNLTEQGVTLVGDETFTELAPKVLEISGDNSNEKDINFYDYDGKLLYAYTKEEFKTITELPTYQSANPSYLVPDGWNYTLEEIQETVNRYGICDVGVQYNTISHGLIIKLNVKGGTRRIGVNVSFTNDSGVIEWGDGSIENIDKNKSFNGSHVYEKDDVYYLNIHTSDFDYGRITINGTNEYLFSSGTTPVGIIMCNGNYTSGNYVEEIYIGNRVNDTFDKGFKSISNYTYVPKSISMNGNCNYQGLLESIDYRNVQFLIIPRSTTRTTINTTALQVKKMIVPTTINKITTMQSYSIEKLIAPKASVTLPGYNLKEIYAKSINISTGQFLTKYDVDVIERLSRANITSIVASFDDGKIPSYYMSENSILSDVDIVDGTTIVGTYAFAYCYSLSHINLPNTITTIGNYAFYACFNLENVNLKNGITKIDDYAFQFCRKLNNILLPNTVTSLGYSTFAYCDALTEIEIPESVATIRGLCFGNDISLTTIKLRSNTPPTLQSSNVFSPINANAVFYVPYSEDHSVLNTYQTSSNWSTYADKMQEFDFENNVIVDIGD